MALEIGSRLGHYDVTALVGEGGIGQVYSATDTKLNRQVALKRVACVLAMLWVAMPGAQAQKAGQFFDSNGVQLHYVDQGAGEPVVLLHGFTGSYVTGWDAPGSIAALLGAGYRVIALDCRGHGMSGKPVDPQQYGWEMVVDVVRLLDHLNVDRAHVAGYSMGGMIADNLRAGYPDRLLTATLGGYGWPGEKAEERVSANLEWAAELETSASPDGSAQAAVLRGFEQLLQIDASNLRANTVPTLALLGAQDPSVEYVERQASVMSNLEVITIPGATHVTAYRDAAFIEHLVAFLDEHSRN